jgi:hypothetical protein
VSNSDKTLTIRIKSDLGDTPEALKSIEKALQGTGVAVKQLNTISKQIMDADGIQTTNEHVVKLTASTIAAAQAARDLVHNLALAGDATIGNTGTASTSAIRADTFNSSATVSNAALQQRLTLERSIRINGITDIKTLQIQAAADEKAIQQKLATDIAAIEQQIASGTLNNIHTATSQRVALERTAASQITAIRRSIETVQAGTQARSTSADIYRAETAQLQTEMNRRIALEVSIRSNGINHIRTIELQAANDEIAIRRNASSQLQAIEDNLRAGVISNRGAANASRTAIMQRTEAQIVSNQVTLAAAQATAQENAALAANAAQHTSIIGRAAEFIGIYRVLNAVINAVSNSIRAIPAIGIQKEATLASLSATVGIGGMDSVYKALTDEAHRTGIEIATVRENFRTFQASASLAGESLADVWHMFTNINTVSTALHLSADKVQLTFLAISQIFNKTRVQSEELVKQLGNLLPGAFASYVAAWRDNYNKIEVAAGRAAVTQQQASLLVVKSMKAGTEAAHDNILNFTDFYATRFAAAFELARKGLNANVQDMKTNFQLLGESIYNVSSGPLLGIVKGLGAAAEGMTKLVTATGTLSTVLTTGVNIALGATFVLLGNFVAGLGWVQAGIAGIGTVIAEVTTSITTVGLAATAVGGLEVAFAFLSSPAVLVAGIVAATIALAGMGAEAKDTEDRVLKARKAFDDKLAATTPELKLTLAIEENASVKQAVADVDTYVKQLKELDKSITAESKLPFVSKNPETGTGNAKERLHIQTLLNAAVRNEADTRAIMTDDLTKQAKLEAENAANFAAGKDTVSDKEVNKQQAAIDKAAGYAANIMKSMIRTAEADAKLALDQLKTMQEEVDAKVKERQLSFNDAYLERLRISKEILAVELTRANKEINAVQGKPALADALVNRSTADPKFMEALQKYATDIQAAATKYGVSSDIIKAVIMQESSGVLTATNKNKNGSTDSGLMQVNSAAHSEVNQQRLVQDVSYSIDSGVKILATSLKSFPGDLTKGLAAYNAGVAGAKNGKGTDYSNQVQGKLGIVSQKQVMNSIKDTSQIDAQTDAISRAYEADKQRTIEAEKLLFINNQELLVMKNTIDKDYMRLTGMKDEANIAEINNKYRVQEEVLAINGMTTEKEKLGLIKQSEVLNLGLNTISTQRAAAEQLYRDKVQETQTLLQAGMISGNAVQGLLVSAKKVYLDLQMKEIAQLNKIIALEGKGAIDAKNKLMLIQEAGRQQAMQSAAIANNILTKNDTTGLVAIKNTHETDLAAAEKARVDAENAYILQNHKITLDEKAALDKKYIEQTRSADIAYYESMGKTGADAYSTLTNAVVKLFGTKSKEAKTFQAIETGIAAEQMALEAIRAAKTLAYIAIDVAAGAAKMFGQSGWFGFAGVAAMLGVMGGLGYAAASANHTAPAQTSTASVDTGTVLGDSTTKSNSIVNIAQLMKDIQADNYPVLRSIDQGISNLSIGITNVVTRLFQAGGLKSATLPADSIAMGIASGFNKLTTVGGWKVDPIMSWLLGAAFGGKKTSTVTAQGISTSNTSMADIMGGGNLQAQQYADIQTKTAGGWFTSDKYSTSTQYAALDASTQGALNSVFKSMGQTMFGLADTLGAGLSDRVKNYVIPALTVDLKGLNGTDAAAKLNGVLSATLDTMATSVFGDIIGQYQKLGEGMLETAVRIVSEVAVVKDALATSGKLLADNAIAISDALVQAAGGLQEFQKQFSSYFDKFYTDSEKQAQSFKQLSGQLNSVNLNLASTREGYRAQVDAIDITTAAGQAQYSMLLKLSASADTYYSLLANANALDLQKRGLEVQIMQLSGNTLGALTAQRKLDLAAMDSSLRSSQQMIYSLTDANTAVTNAVTAVSTAISTMQALATQLKSAMASTVIDTNISLQQERDSAVALLQTTLNTAQSGGSIDNVTGMDKALTDIAKPSEQLYTSFAQYAFNQAKTGNIISQLATSATDQVSIAQKQLDAANGTTTAVLTLNQSLANLGVAMAAKDVLIQASMQLLAEAVNNTSKTDTEKAIIASFQQVQGHAPTAEELASWVVPLSNNVINLSNLTTEIARTFATIPQRISTTGLDSGMLADIASSSAWLHSQGVPGFAIGTNFVPEDMTANIHKGERIIPAADNAKLMSMLAKTSSTTIKLDNSELIKEIKELRSTVERQQTTLNKIASTTKQTTDILDNSTAGGPMLVKVVA